MAHIRPLLIALLTASLSILAFSCGDDGEESNAAAEGEGEAFLQSSNISECGGFNGVGQALTVESALTIDEATYCDAQVFHWEYDAAAKRLEVLDARMELNCCGEHSMTAEEVDGVLVISERDAPDNDMRCGCTCIFDFGMTLTGIELGQVPFKLMLDVTDNDGPPVVHEGMMDLSEGAGQIVLNDQVSSWCGEQG